VGNLKESYLREGCAEYSKRLSSYCQLSVVELKDGSPLLPHLPPKAYKIALCVEGKQLSSEQLAQTLETIPQKGFSEICFVIGPFDGLTEAEKAACDFALSFSKMTFPHQLMRMILLEQIYRAFTILNGGKYHK
jgi:23S rRNA (pseudouridine1915-N3)-methyltransferase